MASREEKIQQAIKFVFDKYDHDNSGTLDSNELKEVLAALYAKMGLNRAVT